MKYIFNISGLEAARLRSDDVADQLVTTLFETHGPKITGQLFHQYINSLDELNYEDMPDVLRTYFQEQQVLPDWTDIRKIEVAEQLFLNIGPEYALALLCRALPVGYVAANTVKVLTSTGYLSSDVKVGTAKRLLETTQFILDVMSPRAMRPGSRGIKSVLKVRFIHAMVRYQLRRQGWDDSRYGIPVNQEDMAGTIQTFSIAAIMGLDRINLRLSAEERDAMVHFWAVVGHIIGVEEELNPPTYAEARELYETILEHQAAPTEDGRILTRALANFIRDVIDMPYLPGLEDHLIRYLIDNERYSNFIRLARPETALQKAGFGAAMQTLSALNQYRGLAPVARITRPMNRKLALNLLAYFDQEFQMKLTFPDAIRTSWGIDEAPTKGNSLPNLVLDNILKAGRAVSGQASREQTDHKVTA